MQSGAMLGKQTRTRMVLSFFYSLLLDLGAFAPCCTAHQPTLLASLELSESRLAGAFNLATLPTGPRDPQLHVMGICFFRPALYCHF